MGKNIRIRDLPNVEIRESTYELDKMLKQLSAINTNHTNVSNDFTEALLCLGNEIKKIKLFLELD